MISNRMRRHLEHEVEKVKERVITRTEKDLLISITKMLDANKLYVHLFGSKTPISATITFTPALQELSHHFPPDKKLKDSQNYLSVDILDDGLLRLPLTSDLILVVTNLKRCQHFDGVTERTYSWGRQNWCSIENSDHGFADSYVETCRNLIAETIGASSMETLDRILNLRMLLSDLPNAFDGYIKACHSLGGLFKKLPVLNSLIPTETTGKVEHVTMTRLTPDPPPELVERLNILATLHSATQKGD